jgi:hypothetical protein
MGPSSKDHLDRESTAWDVTGGRHERNAKECSQR